MDNSSSKIYGGRCIKAKVLTLCKSDRASQVVQHEDIKVPKVEDSETSKILYENILRK